MTANKIFEMRTGITDSDIITTYVELATERVIAFLGITAEDDLTPYVTQIADISVLLWQMDASTQNISATLGYTSHSFSEGGVSESISGASGQDIWEMYTSAIDNVLQTLRGTRLGVVRFI